MHEQRGQFPVYAETRRSLEEHLTWSMLKAQVACNKVSISIPNYALALLPRLRYNVGGDGRPFPYQFLVFFSPSAKRIRGVRIGRVRAVLDAATNAAHAFSEGPGIWPVGDPIGISIDVTELSEDDNKLLAAYLAMGVPVEGELAKGLEPASISPEEAKELIIGRVLGKSALITEIPHDSPGFKPDSGSDDDALDYAQLDPAYEEHGFDADGVAMTEEQRQEAAADAYMEEIQGQEEEEHPMEEDPAPPYVQTESAAGAVFATSALQGSLEEPPSTTQPLLLTPTSTVESIPSSEAVSAASSSTPDVTLPRPRKSTVAARRSRNYRGPYVQPASSSSSSRSRPPFARRSPSPRRYSPPRHATSRAYSPARRQSYRRSPSPGYGQIRRRSPSPRGRGLPIVPGVRIIQTREQHRIVQDTDTGISALVPVMQVSSSQMGLDLSALIHPSIPEGPRGRIGPQGYTHPRPVEGSHESGGSRYPPRSRSPRRNYYSHPCSPSPRRSDHDSGHYSLCSGSQRSPPRRMDPPRHRSPRPGPTRRRDHEPALQDPMTVWGETTEDPALSWGNPDPPATASSLTPNPTPSSSSTAAKSSVIGNNSTPGAGPSGTS